MALSLQNYLYRLVEESLPGLSIECVILGYQDLQLKTLVFKTKGFESWSLPGGFIKKDEQLDQAANRIVEERAGLKSLFLNQFHVFGNPDKSFGSQDGSLGQMEAWLNAYELKEDEVLKKWFSMRQVTIGYYALVDIQELKTVIDPLFESCEWISVEQLPELILNQKKTVSKALEHLRIQLHYQPISQSLLPDRFTMPELQRLYEILLGKPLVRSNFQRKMLDLGLFLRHEKKMSGSANKAPYLYSFDPKKYQKALQQGIGFRL